MRNAESIFNSKIEELLRGNSKKATIDKLLKKQGQTLNYYRDLVDYCEYKLNYRIHQEVSTNNIYIAVETLDGEVMSEQDGYTREEFYEYKAKKLLYKLLDLV